MISRYFSDIWTHGFGNDTKYPTFLNFSVSNRCNARCKMCDIWRHPSDDLPNAQLTVAFQNPYLQNIEVFGITGGEPFLKGDLPDLIGIISDCFPKLRHLGITTNGFNTARIDRLLTQALPRIREIPSFGITVSVDGIGPYHDESRGVAGVWKKVEKTIELLKTKYDNSINLSFACTITKSNANSDALEELASYANSKNVPIIYRIAVLVDRIYNEQLIQENGVTPKTIQADEIVKFLNKSVLTHLTPRVTYYYMIKDYLMGNLNNRSIKCKEMRDGLMIDSNADVYVCSVSGKKIGNLLTDSANELVYSSSPCREQVRSKNCSTCFHDHLSHKAPTQLMGAAARLLLKN